MKTLSSSPLCFFATTATAVVLLLMTCIILLCTSSSSSTTTFLVSATTSPPTTTNNNKNNNNKNNKKKPTTVSSSSSSWRRWGVEWMKSISAATEELSETTKDMISPTSVSDGDMGIVGNSNSQNQKQQLFSFTADPVRSMAAAMTNLVGGVASVAQIQSSMSKEDKKKHLKYHQDRIRRQQEQKQQGTKGNSMTMMDLEDDSDDSLATATTNVRNLNRYAGQAKQERKSFSKTVIKQQKNLQDKLFNRHNIKSKKNSEEVDYQNSRRRFMTENFDHIARNNNNKNNGYVDGIVSGKYLSKEKKTVKELERERIRKNKIIRSDEDEDDANANNKKHQPFINPEIEQYPDFFSSTSSVKSEKSSNRPRVAHAQAEVQPQEEDEEENEESEALSPELLAARNIFASSCSVGIVAVPYKPDMNFTCFDPKTLEANSSFTVNGSTYASSFTLRQRLACFPEEIITLPRYCVCSVDRYLLRHDSSNTFSCHALSYDCNMTITEPSHYHDRMNANLVNSLLDGVPLRLPYINTIDRTESTTPTQISATVKCQPEEYQDNDPNDGITHLGPSQVSPANSSLVAVYFTNSAVSTLRQMMNTSNEAVVVGTYQDLQMSMYSYVSNVTTQPATTNGNETTAASTPFLLTVTNFLYRRGLFFLRPHSFLDFSDVSGASVIRVSDLAASASTAYGLLLGLQNVSLSFLPSDLGDHFFTGGQLTAEFGYMLPALTHTQSLERNISYLSADYGAEHKYTPMAHLITFDVRNAPPALPPAPEPPLATSTIVLISIGAVAGAAGLIAIVVGIIRYRNGLERKKVRMEHRRQVKQEEAELKKKRRADEKNANVE